MMLFDEYPGAGHQLLGPVSGANCRHEYGPQFIRKTRQTKCAYCGVDFAGSYETWLTMALDHVVSLSVCRELGIPAEWADDSANKVLACTACNSFCNRYKPAESPTTPVGLEEFFDFRDRVFAERKGRIAERHQQEQAFFESRRWLDS